MSDKLLEREAELMPAIESAGNNTRMQALVCAAAYAAIQETEESLQAELFAWFVLEANKCWVQNASDDKDREIWERLESGKEMTVGEAAKLLQALDEGQEPPSTVPDDLKSSVAESDLNKHLFKFGQLVRGVLNLCINEGYSTDEYYAKLWNMVKSLFATYSNEEQGVCLHIIVCDWRTPYQFVGPGLRMSNEEYQNITDEISPQLQTMLYILKMGGQRTEVTSRLIHLMEGLVDEKQKAVFLSQLIVCFEPDE